MTMIKKPFNCEEVLELIKNGNKKAVLDYDLSYTSLRGANLTRAKMDGASIEGADIDFSCWPLWCGSLKVKTDVRQAAQLAYHLRSMQCEDEDFVKMGNSMLDFANKFHRVDECERLEIISVE